MPSTIRVEDDKIKERFDQIQRDQSAKLKRDLTQTNTLELIINFYLAEVKA